MKNKFFLKFALCFLAIGCFITIVFAQQQDEKKLIIGTWINEERTIKFVFTSAMKCYQYYEGKFSNSYKYKISNSSPQCGEKVFVNKNEETSYLELTNLKDGTKTCFEINGFTPKTLSLTSIGFAHPNLFIRQTYSVIKKKKIKSTFQTSSNFNGYWTDGIDGSVFDLLLTQKGSTLTGSYCSTMLNGNKIDCDIDSTDLSINGVVTNSNTVTVDFKSQFSRSSGKAMIKKISDTQIKWVIIKEPKGEYYIPNSAVLSKQ